MALDHNANTNDIDDKELYHQGRHFIGLGHHFIKFPMTAVDVTPEDLIPARTEDGLGVSMKIAYQYQLSDNIDHVVELYRTFGMNYEDVFFQLSLSSMRDVCAGFKGYDLVSQREELAQQMKDDLHTRLAEYHASIVSYQVLSIRWPSQIDDAIMKMIVAIEDIQTAFAEKNITQISAETSVMEAVITSDTVVIDANKTAKILLAGKTAEAEVIKLESGAQAEAFGAVKAAFSSMTSEQLLEYVYLENIVGGDMEIANIAVKIPAEIKAAMNGE